MLHPNLTLKQAEKQLLADITEDREYASVWDNASLLDRLILKSIKLGEKELFGETKRAQLAKQMGIDTLAVSTLQSSIRSLQKKNIIGSAPEHGAYYIDDPNFKNWIEDDNP